MSTTTLRRSMGVRIPTTGPNTPNAPSALDFVARFITASIGAVLGIALILAAPLSVTVPLAVVLGGGAVASGLVVGMDRWLTHRRRRHSGRGSAAAARRSPGALRWSAIAILSVLLMALALFAPAPIDLMLTAGGLVGVVTARVAASLNDWVPRRTWAART